MTIPRRAALAVPLLPFAARAQDGRSVRLVAPFGPGSTVDLMGRALSAPLSERLGGTVVVENRAGAGGNLGVDAVAKAAPDGTVLGIGTSGPLSINPVLMRTMPYRVADLAPVSLIAIGPNVLVANRALGVTDAAGLVALAKARPGALNYGSPGVGSTGHLAGELFRAVSGAEVVHVPYRGNAEAMADLLAGRLAFLFSGLPPVLPLAADGRVRVLAVAGPRRVAALPTVPTVAEAGLPGAESISYYGIVAPAATPAATVARLNTAVGAALATPALRTPFEALGSEAEASTPEAFGALIASETTKWRGVIERFGIRPE